MMHRGPVRVMDKPECGYWLIRLAKDKPLAPACIQLEQTLIDPDTGESMDRSPILTARIWGEIVAWEKVWHTRGTPITKAEHDYLVATHRWQKEYSKDEPLANPYKAVDLTTIPPIEPPS